MVADRRYVIPAGIVTALVDDVARRGWDLGVLLTAAGFEPAETTIADARLTEEQVRALVRAAWEITDDDLLGLGLRRVPHGTLRMLCFAMASVPDLRRAITRFAEFSEAVAGLPRLTLELAGPDAVIRIDTSGLDDPTYMRTVVTAAATVRLLTWTIGRPVPIRWIELPVASAADLGGLDGLLGESVRFGADAVTIVLDAAVLDTPVLYDEESLLRFLRDAPVHLLAMPVAERSLTKVVRRAIEKRLTEHSVPTAEDLAAQLSMSVPSLRRKLRAEGTSLRAVRDDVRYEVALAGLERGTEPLAALAERLGFSEPSAFTRAFRRWAGHPPSAHRPDGDSKRSAGHPIVRNL